MPRLEETITALGCLLGEFPGEEYCKNCVFQPYRFGDCKYDAIKDARKRLYGKQRQLTDHEKACLENARNTYEVDKRNDRNAVILPIRVVEVLLGLAES